MKMSIFDHFFQINFLTFYVFGKIEGHVLSQSTPVKNGGDVPPRLLEAPMIKPPFRFQRLTSPVLNIPRIAKNKIKFLIKVIVYIGINYKFEYICKFATFNSITRITRIVTLIFYL